MGPDESALPTPDAAFPCCCAGITSRAGSCSSAPGSAPSLSHEELGSSCHNKSAAGSLRDSQDSSPCQAAIAAPRERLLWAEIRNPLVTDSLSSVYKLSDTIKTLREKENGFFCCLNSRGMDYLSRSLSWWLRRGTPALCTPG